MRENVTCEGVLFTLPVGCSRLLSDVNDLIKTKSCQNFTLRMSEHPKQVSLFFEAAHMSSEVMDNL